MLVLLYINAVTVWCFLLVYKNKQYQKLYYTELFRTLGSSFKKKRQSVFSKVMVIKLPRRQCRFTDPKSLSTEHFSATTHRYTAVLKHFLVIFANHVDKTHQRQTCLRIRWSCVSFRPSVQAKQFHFAKASKQCSCNYELKKKKEKEKNTVVMIQVRADRWIKAAHQKLDILYTDRKVSAVYSLQPQHDQNFWQHMEWDYKKKKRQ